MIQFRGTVFHTLFHEHQHGQKIALPDHYETFLFPFDKLLASPQCYNLTFGGFYIAVLVYSREGLKHGLVMFSQLPLYQTLRRYCSILYQHFELNEQQGHVATDVDPEWWNWSTGATLSPPPPLVSSCRDFPFGEIFQRLKGQQILYLLCAMLMENKIVLLSQSVNTLAWTIAGLKELLEPFVWCHVCMSYLPEDMIEYLHCPTPFLFGMKLSTKATVASSLSPGQSSQRIHAIFNEIPDLIVVDLDRGKINWKTSNRRSFPAKMVSIFREQMRYILHANVDERDGICEVQDQLVIDPYVCFPQEALAGAYREFMLGLTNDLTRFVFRLEDFETEEEIVVFDAVRFLKQVVELNCDSDTRQDTMLFYHHWFNSQLFSQYLTTRMGVQKAQD